MKSTLWSGRTTPYVMRPGNPGGTWQRTWFVHTPIPTLVGSVARKPSISCARVLTRFFARLASHTLPVSVALDAFRHINPVASTAVRGYFADSKTDLDTFGLPIGWDYLINKDGVGRSLVFPVLLKPSVQWSTRNFKLGDAGTLVQLAQTPYERINIRCCTDAYFLHWQFHD